MENSNLCVRLASWHTEGYRQGLGWWGYWGVGKFVDIWLSLGVLYDTTPSDSSPAVGTVALLEEELGQMLVKLACRHHIYDLFGKNFQLLKKISRFRQNPNFYHTIIDGFPFLKCFRESSMRAKNGLSIIIILISPKDHSLRNSGYCYPKGCAARLWLNRNQILSMPWSGNPAVSARRYYWSSRPPVHPEGWYEEARPCRDQTELVGRSINSRQRWRFSSSSHLPLAR